MLSLVSWGVTSACPLNCPHCYRDSRTRPSPDELSLEECLKVVDEIARVRPRLLILSGGEPLLRPDLDEIVRYASSRRLRVAVATSLAVATPQLIKRLVDAGLRLVAVSLDGAKPETHDRFRGVPGLFKRVVEYIRVLVDLDVTVQVNFTLTRENIGEVHQAARLAEKLGAKFMHVLHFLPVGRGRENFKRLAVSVREALDVIFSLLEHEWSIVIKPTCIPQFWPLAKTSRPEIYQRLATVYAPGCIAGTRYVYISPRGDVQPCPYVDLVLGNLRSCSMEEVMRSNLVAKLTRRELEGSCGKCQYREICGGCRARAYELTNSVLGEDPECPLRESIERQPPC